jgi:hypothetical protein
MDDTQREQRVADAIPSGRQADESQTQQASTVPPARMLANPRRVRRA